VPAVGASAAKSASSSAIMRRAGGMGPSDTSQQQYNTSMGPPPVRNQAHRLQSRDEVDFSSEHQGQRQQRPPDGPPEQQKADGFGPSSGNKAPIQKESSVTRPQPMAIDYPSNDRQEPGGPGAGTNDSVIVLDGDDDDVIQDIDKQLVGNNKGRTTRPVQGNLQPRPMSNLGRAIAGSLPNRHPLRRRPAVNSPPAQQSRGGPQGSTGDILNRTINDLMSRNSMLEKGVNELNFALKAQMKTTEAAEARVKELTANLETQTKYKSEIFSKHGKLEKFVRSLGEDYNTLNTRNLDLNNRLKEALTEKDNVRNELESNRATFMRALEESERERINFRERARAIHVKIDGTRDLQRFSEAALNEKASLLAEERDRSQTLEMQIQEERKASLRDAEKFEEIRSLVVELNASLMSKIEEGDGVKTEKCVNRLNNPTILCVLTGVG